jgi:two-component system cell cycle sensor histidine kinase/response regulator CckA
VATWRNGALGESVEYPLAASPLERSALAFLSSANRPMDLVVSDIVMPSMSGVRLAEQIRAQWPSVKVRFVPGFPTSDALPSSESSSIPLLGKPFTPDDIEAKERELLDSEAKALAKRAQ